MSGERIFAWPTRPEGKHLLAGIMAEAGWTFADNPDEAEWRLLHMDSTFLGPSIADPWEGQASNWINGRCRDISKSRVGRVHEHVFGYPLLVDPRTWQGPMLVKAERNYTKDGRMVTGPIAAPERGYCYQRYIETEAPDGKREDIRLIVVGTQLLPGYLHRWRPGGLVISDWVDREWQATRPGDLITPEEGALVLACCRELGMDYGGVDLLRDRHDGRLYLIDANPTVGAASATESYLLETIQPPVIRAFHEEFGMSPPNGTG